MKTQHSWHYERSEIIDNGMYWPTTPHPPEIHTKTTTSLASHDRGFLPPYKQDRAFPAVESFHQPTWGLVPGSLNCSVSSRPYDCGSTIGTTAHFFGLSTFSLDDDDDLGGFLDFWDSELGRKRGGWSDDGQCGIGGIGGSGNGLLDIVSAAWMRTLVYTALLYIGLEMAM